MYNTTQRELQTSKEETNCPSNIGEPMKNKKGMSKGSDKQRCPECGFKIRGRNHKEGFHHRMKKMKQEKD